MVFPKRKKIHAMLALLVFINLLLTACATVPPQPYASYPAAAGPSQPEGDEEPLPSREPGVIAHRAPTPTAEAYATTAPALPPEPPGHVELFYPGMISMMGFADAPRATIYEYAMDALPACVSLCWPKADVSCYRYGGDADKESMLLSKDLLLKHIGEPYFYLESEWIRQPGRVKRAGMPVVSHAENFNEPIPGFYQATGLPAPSPVGESVGRTGGTVDAVLASDPDSLTIIVTDLHELRADDGALLSALSERCLETGRSIGMAAIVSEFSGYIPDIGVNGTAFVWGAPPTGTRDYLLEFSDYLVGVSIDAQTREVAPRPFYILCIGEQGAVDTYLRALSDRLSREFADNGFYKFRSATFGSGYVPADYTLAGNVRYTGGQGVTAIPEESAPAGVNLIELKASQQDRYLTWDVEYKIHPSDPRGLRLAAADFTFLASAINGSGQETVLPHLSWEVTGAAGGSVTLRLRLDLPQGILAQGKYTLGIIGSLAGPGDMPGSEWLGEFGFDADGGQLFDMEQGVLPFDGSRTLYLARLIDALGKANISRMGVASLGTVVIALTVYA